jgi:transcriptional regulator with PAS, ATPase and Fis domain
MELNKRNTLPKIENKDAFSPIVTRSLNMFRVLREAELHAASNIPVLITGETGTGKELLARAIHAASPRAKHTFTPINMESINSQMFEAQFFGHNKGAFTGADKDSSGYLEASHRGTVFLDEVGTLPPDLQGKLLRFLQEGEVIKIGAVKPQKVDVRVISATNADMERIVEQRKFRRDLFYRLKGGWLHLPPLRERKEDIPPLVRHFMTEMNAPGGHEIDAEILSALTNYEFPGNIRELKSILMSAVNLSQGSPVAIRHLPPALQKKNLGKPIPHAGKNAPLLTLKEMEERHILSVYEQLGKNKSQTARVLGIALNTLRNKLESYGR